MWKPIKNTISKLYHKYCYQVEHINVRVENKPIDCLVANHVLRSDFIKDDEYIECVKQRLANRLATEMLDKGYIKFTRYLKCDYSYGEPSDELTTRIDVVRRDD